MLRFESLSCHAADSKMAQWAMHLSLSHIIQILSLGSAQWEVFSGFHMSPTEGLGTWGLVSPLSGDTFSGERGRQGLMGTGNEAQADATSIIVFLAYAGVTGVRYNIWIVGETSKTKTLAIFLVRQFLPPPSPPPALRLG